MMPRLARFRSAAAPILHTTLAAGLYRRPHVRWWRLAQLLAIICIPLWTACGENDDITPPPPLVLPDLAGPWVGTFPPDDSEVRLNLVSGDGLIRGSGAIFIGERVFTMQVVGSMLSSGDVVLNLFPFPPNRILFRGKLTGDSVMTGTLTESGYGGEEVTFTRR